MIADTCVISVLKSDTNPSMLYLTNSDWRIYVPLNWDTNGSGIGLSPIRCQAISWTNAIALSFGPLKSFSGILIEIETDKWIKMHQHLQISVILSWPQYINCLIFCSRCSPSQTPSSCWRHCSFMFRKCLRWAKRHRESSTRSRSTRGRCP